MKNLLEAKGLKKSFPVRGRLFSRHWARVRAVRGVSFGVGEGETLGLVGESGCGKTTLGRMLVRLIEPEAGQLLFRNADISRLKGKDLQPIRRKIQMIFQDPYASLNPRMSVGEIITEPLVVHRLISRKKKEERASELLQGVGLSPEDQFRFPHEFSGGQRQRVGIARALSLRPELIIADEPVSSLDVSIAAQILELMKNLQRQFRISYVFIAHDLRMVRYMSDRIAVMYLGEIVEMAPKGGFGQPLHPYTQALVEAVPVLDLKHRRRRLVLSGEVPSPVAPPPGCSFHPRCPFAEARCRQESPVLKEWLPGHWAACHFADRIAKERYSIDIGPQ